MAFFISGLSGNWLVFFITLANAGASISKLSVLELKG
jgi:hypothetical protein